MGHLASPRHGVAHSCFSDTASSLLPLRSYGTDSRSVFANIKPRGVSGHTQSGSFSTPMIQSNIHLSHHREDNLMLCHDMQCAQSGLSFIARARIPWGYYEEWDPESGKPESAARLQRRIPMISPPPKPNDENENGAKDSTVFLPPLVIMTHLRSTHSGSVSHCGADCTGGVRANEYPTSSTAPSPKTSDDGTSTGS
jgi:hypothetical protein